MCEIGGPKATISIENHFNLIWMPPAFGSYCETISPSSTKSEMNDNPANSIVLSTQMTFPLSDGRMTMIL